MPDTRPAISCALLLAASLSFAQQMPASAVQISTVSRTEVAPTVAVPGTVYSRNEVQITAGVAGRLVMVAEPGTIVRQGDYVARIDKNSLSLQRAEQEALFERAQINIRQLESQLRRQKELASSSLVSEFELEQTEANRDLALSDANIIEVRIRQIDDLLQRADIRAPFSGVVIDRSRRAGEEVARGEVLGQMTDIEHLEVRAFVPLKHLPRTAAGQVIDILATDASHTGTIRSLVPTGDLDGGSARERGHSDSGPAARACGTARCAGAAPERLLRFPHQRRQQGRADQGRDRRFIRRHDRGSRQPGGRRPSGNTRGGIPGGGCECPDTRIRFFVYRRQRVHSLRAADRLSTGRRHVGLLI
jgi:RND family efflux transporter MFP subunit